MLLQKDVITSTVDEPCLPTATTNVKSDFSVWPVRVHLKAPDPVWFPPGKAGNVLRGAFGTIFRRLACVPAWRNRDLVRACAAVRTTAGMGDTPVRVPRLALGGAADGARHAPGRI